MKQPFSGFGSVGEGLAESGIVVNDKRATNGGAQRSEAGPKPRESYEKRISEADSKWTDVRRRELYRSVAIDASVDGFHDIAIQALSKIRGLKTENSTAEIAYDIFNNKQTFLYSPDVSAAVIIGYLQFIPANNDRLPTVIKHIIFPTLAKNLNVAAMLELLANSPECKKVGGIDLLNYTDIFSPLINGLQHRALYRMFTLFTPAELASSFNFYELIMGVRYVAKSASGAGPSYPYNFRVLKEQGMTKEEMVFALSCIRQSSHKNFDYDNTLVMIIDEFDLQITV